MTQHKDLDILRTIPARAQHQQVDHEPDKSVETGHALILTDAHQAVQTDTRNPTSTYPDRYSAPTRLTHGRKWASAVSMSWRSRVTESSLRLVRTLRERPRRTASATSLLPLGNKIPIARVLINHSREETTRYSRPADAVAANTTEVRGSTSAEFNHRAPMLCRETPIWLRTQVRTGRSSL
jgi:hypothetical protein